MTDTPIEPSGADEPSFFGADPAKPVASAPAAYRVLARKYRPQTFADLIGQEALVRTVTNAFAANRIPQAWMLTGVRGVGKTTTARILARALNYAPGPEGGVPGPTVEMPVLGLHCRAIMESRHVDVLEIDAASHTGVDNIRQITDAVRYAPVEARYKVYIIDEVHMLSPAAFNAFLKTLEEPPPHAKFVFATTEIRKVPVTILSRCQRFDLRRVETGVLTRHLARICTAEAVEAEEEALAVIARAAEGSVRDALSLLDQAVAHGAGRVAAASVREMLGQADRGQVVALFEAAMRGDVPASFALLRRAWEGGADPGQILIDLAAFTHLVTRVRHVPQAASDPALTETERLRATEFASALSVGTLSRAWQILLKAIPEVAGSGQPLAAAEMALVRLAYAATLPGPEEAIRVLRGAEPRAREAGPAAAPSLAPGPTPVALSGGGASAMRAPDPAPRAAPAAGPEPIRLARFEDVVALARENREIGLVTALETAVRLVRFEDGHIELALAEGAPRTLPNDLARVLDAWTGRRWIVALSSEGGAPTLAEARRQRESERRSDAVAHPLVQSVLASFPGATIVEVRDRVPSPDTEPALPAPDADPEETREDEP